MEELKTTTKPQIFVDASSLKDSSCLRRLVYNNFYGFIKSDKKSNYKAAYGSAFHRALEYWYSTDIKNKEVEGVAIQKAIDYYKPYTPFISDKDYEYRTPTHLVKSLEAYFKNYNQDCETLKPIKGVITPGLLESKFTYPAILLDQRFASPHFDLIVAGTVDMIASHFGQECFVDHKSTGTKWGYKDDFFKDFELSVQMMLYTYILRKLTGTLFPFIINGVFLKKPTQAAEKKFEFDGVNFERYGPKSYTDIQLEQFEWWLFNRMQEFHNWLTIYYTLTSKGEDRPSLITLPNFSSCQSKWLCQYYSVCSQSPEVQDRILGLMSRDQYNPLLFSE